MMLTRTSTSSEHSSFLPSSKSSSIKNDAASSGNEETEYSSPPTVNGSLSPKSSIDEAVGMEESHVLSPVSYNATNIIESLTTTTSKTKKLRKSNSNNNNNNNEEEEDDDEDEDFERPEEGNTTQQQLFNAASADNSTTTTAIPTTTQLPPLDIQQVFGDFFASGANKFGNFLTTSSDVASSQIADTKVSSEGFASSGGGASIDFNAAVVALHGMVDPTAFLQHLLTVGGQPQQSQSTLLSSLHSNEDSATTATTDSKTFKMEVDEPPIHERSLQQQQQRHEPSQQTIQDKKQRSYPYTFQYCVLCDKNVHSSKLPCHIRQCHVGKPMFQCPNCDFTSTYSKNNVKSHMVSLHGLAGDPISYMDQYAGDVEEFMKKCFPNVRGRGRPVHGRSPPSTNHSSHPAASAHADFYRKSPHSPTNSFNNFHANSNHQRLGVLKAASGGKAHQQRYNKSSATNNNNNNNNVALPSLPSLSSAKFNEMYTLAMLGGATQRNSAAAVAAAAAFGASNPYGMSLTSSNNADYPPSALQSTPTPAFGISPPALIPDPKMLLLKGGGSSGASEEEKPSTFGFNNLLADYMGGMEQFFKSLNQSATTTITPSTAAAATTMPTTITTTTEPASQPTQTQLTQQNCTGKSNEKYVRRAAYATSSTMLESGCAEPRYLPQNLKWTVLDADQLERTVFKTFTNTSELIEKLDLSLFESLMDRSNAFLTPEQLRRIADVRRQLDLKSFEIMFAVHRLDLQVLKGENVKLVESIAPTLVDIRRFSLYEQSNSITSLSENEQFILQLSKIDRLKDKLAVMGFMGSFNERIVKVNQQLCDCVNASKMLQNSSEFHTILHLLLTFGNLINGDFNGQLVEGFQPSKILEMCAFKFPNGVTLLEALADRIERFTELKKFQVQCSIVEDASKVEFFTILHTLKELEDGQRLVEFELQLGGPNQLLTGFLAHCENEIAQLKEIINLAKDQIIAMLEFFGEPVFREYDDLYQFRPETFFLTISAFAKSLESVVCESVTASPN